MRAKAWTTAFFPENWLIDEDKRCVERASVVLPRRSDKTRWGRGCKIGKERRKKREGKGGMAWLSLQLFLQFILLIILSMASRRVPVWKKRLKSVSVSMP